VLLIGLKIPSQISRRTQDRQIPPVHGIDHIPESGATDIFCFLA